MLTIIIITAISVKVKKMQKNRLVKKACCETGDVELREKALSLTLGCWD